MVPQRTLLVLVPLVAAALAGCAAPAGTAEDAAQVAGTPPTIRLSHDYGRDAPGTETFDIPASPATYDVLLRIGGAGPTVCAPTSDGRLVVRTPTGEEYADLRSASTAVSSGSGNSGCAQKTVGGVVLPAGTWTVEFSGSGSFVGIVEITPRT